MGTHRYDFPYLWYFFFFFSRITSSRVQAWDFWLFFSRSWFFESPRVLQFRFTATARRLGFTAKSPISRYFASVSSVGVNVSNSRATILWAGLSQGFSHLDARMQECFTTRREESLWKNLITLIDYSKKFSRARSLGNDHSKRSHHLVHHKKLHFLLSFSVLKALSYNKRHYW